LNNLEKEEHAVEKEMLMLLEKNEEVDVEYPQNMKD